jgi:hypothetical protein
VAITRRSRSEEFAHVVARQNAGGGLQDCSTCAAPSVRPRRGPTLVDAL